jgi:hypothetical protein
MSQSMCHLHLQRRLRLLMERKWVQRRRSSLVQWKCQPFDRPIMGSEAISFASEASPAAAKGTTYSVFWDGDTYKGVRQSVITEACETEVYSPAVEPTPPPPPAKPARKRNL